MKVALQQMEVSKPNGLAEAAPPLPPIPYKGRKHLIFSGTGNVLSLCCRLGMLSWYSIKVLSDDIETPRVVQPLG